MLIIIIGIFLRFYRIRELTTFLSDQAIELSGARQILHGDLALIGIKTSNSEVRNGAVMYYVLAPFLYFFSLDPIAGGILQSLLSISTVILVYFLGKRFINDNAGLFAALFVSASPLLVKFSRQTMLAFYPLFFTTLGLLFAIKIIKSEKKYFKYIILLGFLTGFVLQIHYSTVSLFLFSCLLPVIFKLKIKKLLYYFWFSGGFILGVSPLIIFELRNRFFNSKMFLAYLSGNHIDTLHFSFNHVFYWIDSIGKVYGAQNWWLAVIIFAIIAWRIMKWRTKLEVLEKLCLLQIGSTFIFTTLFVREMVVHYGISAFVPIALLLGTSINKIINLRMSPKYLLFFIIFTISFIYLNYPYYGLTDNHGWMMTSGWNLPAVEKSAVLIANNRQNEKFNVAMVVDAQNQGIPLRYFLTNLGEEPLSFSDYESADLLYVVTEPGINLKEIKMWEIISFGNFKIDKTWPVQNEFLLFRLSKNNV